MKIILFSGFLCVGGMRRWRGERKGLSEGQAFLGLGEFENSWERFSIKVENIFSEF